LGSGGWGEVIGVAVMSNDDELLEVLKTQDTPCPECGYNLRGLTSAKCPECAAEFELTEEIEWVGRRDVRAEIMLIGVAGCMVPALALLGGILLTVGDRINRGRWPLNHMWEGMAVGLVMILVYCGLVWIGYRSRGWLGRCSTWEQLLLSLVAWLTWPLAYLSLSMMF